MIVNYINAFICFLIAIRIFTFHRNDYKYKRLFNVLAWAIICSSAAVALFSSFHLMERVTIAQTLMNLLVLICLLKSRGNIAQLGEIIKPPLNVYSIKNNKE